MVQLASSWLVKRGAPFSYSQYWTEWVVANVELTELALNRLDSRAGGRASREVGGEALRVYRGGNLRWIAGRGCSRHPHPVCDVLDDHWHLWGIDFFHEVVIL